MDCFSAGAMLLLIVEEGYANSQYVDQLFRPILPAKPVYGSARYFYTLSFG
jgi:hypothetical protein